MVVIKTITVRAKYRNGASYGLCTPYLHLDPKAINSPYGTFGRVTFRAIALLGSKRELVFLECLSAVPDKICPLALIETPEQPQPRRFQKDRRIFLAESLAREKQICGNYTIRACSH